MTLDQAMLIAERAVHEIRDRAYDDFVASLAEQNMPRALRRPALHWYAQLLDDELTKQLANVRREVIATFSDA